MTNGSSFFVSVVLETLLQLQYKAAPDFFEEDEDERDFERKSIWDLLMELERDDDDENKKVVRLFLCN